MQLIEKCLIALVLTTDHEFNKVPLRKIYLQNISYFLCERSTL